MDRHDFGNDWYWKGPYIGTGKYSVYTKDVQSEDYGLEYRVDKEEIEIKGHKYLVSKRNNTYTDAPCDHFKWWLLKDGHVVLKHSDQECRSGNWSGSACSYADNCGWRSPVIITEIIEELSQETKDKKED